MEKWSLSAEQARKYENDGYFTVRNVIPKETAAELRGVIKNTVLMPEPDVLADADPMDPMGDSARARESRFRKLSNYCYRAPLIWLNVHGGPAIARIARYFLGDDLVLKFNSCFLKPARTGSATPWHQDNGLWRDDDTEAFNFWMALDPATRSNGCMQMMPGSHKGEIVPHVLYPDSIHGELPRRLTKGIQDRVHHVEVEPGDIVCWHSSMWHYSPPNPSEQGRIAIAGVYSSPSLIASYPNWSARNCLWVMKSGELCAQFPPEPFPFSEEELSRPTPWPTVEDCLEEQVAD
ncbi:MAG: phytanoyl-CoA dioxygenase family protein [Caldilineaceae bacterium SB0664_bin_27]|uniref:Phytanoyl-CoA dioxygenase family protein n=1 Tax=Caldilineaceae bacterium SB0664_bin_27 TaxID=2605260 RepID=A0A6B0YNI6_9CHLR|nr:phytanoyl-CoA dioxygenase family protein [Caldilineaceae bacterium SB0664_bin_27]